MTTPDFYIKRNDLQPIYKAQVLDSDGDPVSGLSGATIRVTLKNLATGTLKLNRVTTGASVSDATNAYIQYQWQSGDTDTSGKYYIEFEITPGSGGKFTVPTHPDEAAIVYIVDDLDAT